MPFRDDNWDDERYQADDDHVAEGDVCDVEDLITKIGRASCRERV